MKPRRKRAPGAGRKKNPNAIRRTGITVSLMLPPEEHAVYRMHAERMGISLAEYARKALRAMTAWNPASFAVLIVAAMLLATACSAEIGAAPPPPAPVPIITGNEPAPSPAERGPSQTILAPAPFPPAADAGAPVLPTSDAAAAPPPPPQATPTPPDSMAHANVPAPDGPPAGPYDCDPLARTVPATCPAGNVCQPKSCDRATRGWEGICTSPSPYAGGTCEMLPCGGSAQWVGRPNVATQVLDCAPGLACVGIGREVYGNGGGGGITHGNWVCLRLCRVDADCPGGRACVTDGQACDSLGIGHCAPTAETVTTCSTWYAR